MSSTRADGYKSLRPGPLALSPLQASLPSQTRTELLQAIIKGQDAIFNALADLSEGGNAEWQTPQAIQQATLQRNEDLKIQVMAYRKNASLRQQIAVLHNQSGQAAVDMASSRMEVKVLKEQQRQVANERDDYKQQLEDGSRRLESLALRSRTLVAEDDKFLAMRLAAEPERDALSKSLLDLREDFHGKNEERRVAREHLSQARFEH